MTKKELSELPLDKYMMTDNIYDYEVNIDRTGTKHYYIKEANSSNNGRISIFEYEDLKFSCLTRVGALFLHSNDCDEIISKLKIKE